MHRVMSGVAPMPAKETPIDDQAMACPRFSTNHLASVTLTTRLPMSAAPTVSSTPLSTTHCHHAWMNDSANSAIARIESPASMNRRPPNRST